MRSKWFLDEYDFRARLVPSIFVTLPAILALFALLPSLRSFGGLVLGPAIEAVLMLVLVRIARDEGKKVEERLVAEWDGMPTTRFLRHRNNEIDGPLRDRYRAAIAKATGTKLPDAETEEADPAAADATYRSAIAGARGTRSSSPRTATTE